VPDCIKTADRAVTGFDTALIHTTANLAKALLPCVDGKLCSEMYTNYMVCWVNK